MDQVSILDLQDIKQFLFLNSSLHTWCSHKSKTYFQSVSLKNPEIADRGKKRERKKLVQNTKVWIYWEQNKFFSKMKSIFYKFLGASFVKNRGKIQK